MLKIFHVPGTRSVRVIWLCEELGIPYEVQMISFAPEFRLSPEWLKMNPVGKVPAMTDDDGLSMFESGAMVQYLLQRDGKGRLEPSYESPEYSQYLQWCWFAEATFARPLGEIVNHKRAIAKDEQSATAILEMQTRARLCWRAVGDAVGADGYLCKAFTAADIMMGYSMMLCETLAQTDQSANASAYWDRLRRRPGFKIALGYGADQPSPL
ncbi:MAG: glutathione S-transferase [Candidatus Azotimanducaceae bacterium]|jgi:glutathione S-transferase